MNSNYIRLEKIRYAKIAASRRENGEPQILDYKGNNIIKLALRKIQRIRKTYKIIRDTKFYISDLAVVTDFTCNLNCRGCGQHTPEIKKLPDEIKNVDIEQVYKDLDKISQAVDGIGRIALAIGEGFLNRNLEGMMEYYHKNDKILSMNVPTNGTIVPKQNILNKMHQYGVTATITRYEVVPEEKRATVRNAMKENGISVVTFENRKWQLHEYSSQITSSEKETSKKYQHCERYFMLIQGKLWKCVTDATRVMGGLREEREGDSLLINDATVEEVRAFLLEKSNLPHLDSCYHCRGNVGSMVIEIPAGEQIK